MSTIAGFHADDGDDNFFWHTKDFMGLLQGISMFLPEAHAALAASGSDKNGAVFKPGFTFCRTRNGIENTLVQIRLVKHGLKLACCESVLFHHFIDKVAHRLGVG